jgi:hypothetical protein
MLLFVLENLLSWRVFSVKGEFGCLLGFGEARIDLKEFEWIQRSLRVDEDGGVA